MAQEVREAPVVEGQQGLWSAEEAAVDQGALVADEGAAATDLRLQCLEGVGS